jgi:dTDP-4-amino-4,6-dideoxygalactose transaminase
MKNFFVGKPKLINKDLFMKRVEDILDSKVFSNQGPYQTQLESSIGRYLGVRYCLAFNNATAALETALAYLKSKVGFGQVVVPSFTFAATVHSVVRAGFDPIFADINDEYGFDTDSLDLRISKDTVGIIPCNLFGNVNDIAYFERYRQLFTLYDSSHAFGIFDEYYNCCVGNFGDCEVFSCHPTKHTIGAFEGGFLTTNNADIYEFALRYRNFGFSPDAGPQGELSEVIGTNYKMNEIQAAAILCQFENTEDIRSHLFNNYGFYKDFLPSWVTLRDPNTFWSNFSYIPVRVSNSIRNHLVEYLHARGIMARTYFQPLHKTKPYRERFGHLVLPNTERIAQEIICLPTGLDVDDSDVLHICRVIQEFAS